MFSPDRKRPLRPGLDEPRVGCAWASFPFRVYGSVRETRALMTNRDVMQALFRAATDGAAAWRRAVDGSGDSVAWQEHARYFGACGLARPLAASFTGLESTQAVEPAGARAAFFDMVRTRARQDVFRQLTQRRILTRVDEILGGMGVRGVVLKGGGCLAMTAPDDERPSRTSVDLDLYVEPASAGAVHRALIESGFAGDTGAARTAPHHLSPASLQGVEVEVHSRLMPAFWSLPESEMLAEVHALPGLRRLDALGAEAFLLHSVVHAASHLFAFGLKTAWDIQWVSRRSTELDWDRVGRWAAKMSLARAFWVPLRVLCQELDLAVPAELLRGAPTDPRQSRLETFARQRLLRDATGAYELNPVTKNAVILLLHDSWSDRVTYLAGLRAREAAESRASARHNEPMQGFSRLPAHLRGALNDWRSYRRALDP